MTVRCISPKQQLSKLEQHVLRQQLRALLLLLLRSPLWLAPCLL
jgi:hypothetical protein